MPGARGWVLSEFAGISRDDTGIGPRKAIAFVLPIPPLRSQPEISRHPPCSAGIIGFPACPCLMPRFPLPSRAFFAALFTVCTALVGFGLYLQHSLGLEPCPLCVLQRILFIGIGAVALLAALFGARRPAARIGAGLAVTILALAGTIVAARQSWLQHFPPAIQECGADFDFLIDTTPLAQLLPALFSGTGDCSKRDWLFLHLSIAEWALLFFIAIAALALWRSLSNARP